MKGEQESVTQMFVMQTISITVSFSLLSVLHCVGVFCMCVTQMLRRRMSPRDKSQDDSLDTELRGMNSGTNEA